VPLDDEFTVALERVDDRGSTKTRSSKGKRPADRDRDKGLSRTVSRTTISSANTPDETKWDSNPVSPVREEGVARVSSLEDLRREEEQAEREEYEEIERRRRAASQLAMQRGLTKDDSEVPEMADETKDDTSHNGFQQPPAEEPVFGINKTGIDDEVEEAKPPPPTPPEPASLQGNDTKGKLHVESTFVPARLPHFG
jgi:hypothetical protein